MHTIRWLTWPLRLTFDLNKFSTRNGTGSSKATARTLRSLLCLRWPELELQRFSSADPKCSKIHTFNAEFRTFSCPMHPDPTLGKGYSGVPQALPPNFPLWNSWLRCLYKRTWNIERCSSCKWSLMINHTRRLQARLARTLIATQIHLLVLSQTASRHLNC